ncbi:hypothetical protein C9I43_01385 [Shewanella morhuae]|uniref:Uncharacterized protein n=1 Tax=Shewanella morhuae TaxID=365591 RepID=A0ABX5HSR8_9GAMM|nr:hypothetical protein [Shewanella morhuae]PTA49273.1 hypothetical protein C9I43_01385 [Shewanella morhuae]
MDELIEAGVRQGTVLGFSEQLTNKSQEFTVLEKVIKKGRYGHFESKGVSKDHLYVILTQDCSISSGKYIELAQLKKKIVKDEGKVQHLLLGKDYSKLYVKIDGTIYESEESLLTKVPKEILVKALGDGDLKVSTSLDVNCIKIILDWRLLAYRREPFPDNFNRKLDAYFQQSHFWFTGFLAANQDNIHSVRVFVTPEDEEADEYCFAITLILTENGQEKDAEISDALVKMIGEFSEIEGIKGIQNEGFDVHDIDFPENLTISFTVGLDDFSFANAYVMREFNFQYLCY